MCRQNLGQSLVTLIDVKLIPVRKIRRALSFVLTSNFQYILPLKTDASLSPCVFYVERYENTFQLFAVKVVETSKLVDPL